MKYSQTARLFVVLALALLASCAVLGPADLSNVNPNLNQQQRQDVQTATSFVRQAGVDVVANLIDEDGNNKLDLVYTSPNPLKNPEKDLATIANRVGMFMAGCGYPIDKLIVHAGSDSWTADFKSVANCAFGEADKSICTTEKLWGEGVKKEN